MSEEEDALDQNDVDSLLSEEEEEKEDIKEGSETSENKND